MSYSRTLIGLNQFHFSWGAQLMNIKFFTAAFGEESGAKGKSMSEFKLRKSFFTLILSCAFFSLFTGCDGGGTSGTGLEVSGRVLLASGDPVEGATVTAETNQSSSTDVTDRDGNFVAGVVVDSGESVNFNFKSDTIDWNLELDDIPENATAAQIVVKGIPGRGIISVDKTYTVSDGGS